MKRAFTIIRVSDEDQLKGYGPDVQWEDDILPAAPILGLTVSEAYRRIIQESATGWERAKFEAAVREALSLHCRSEIEALLFPRVDRETRFIFGSFPLLAEVVKSGLLVYFAREKLALDPDDPESVERYFSKATQAQAYVQTMKLNTSRAKKKLLREGKLPQGTGVGMYGYNWNRETKRREINEVEAVIVVEIFTRVALGENLALIAYDLNQRGVPTKAARANDVDRKRWHRLTIRRMILNPGYIGQTRFGNVVLAEVTPAIVSEELFYAANAQLNRPKLREGRAKNEYLLRGHAFCAFCGKPLAGHCLSRKFRYYECTNARPDENGVKNCQARFIRAGDLEDMVWSKTQAVLANPDIILKELAEAADTARLESIETEIKELEKGLRNYDHRRSNLLEAMELGEFDKDEILDRLNNLKLLRHEDEAKLNDLRKTRENLAALANARIKLDHLYDRLLMNLHESTPDIKKLALEALDIKVYASTDKVEIKGVIPLELPMKELSSALPPVHNHRQ